MERVLPRICEKVLADGGRLLVVAEEALVATLDELLWTYARDSFLPHGTTAGERAARQPVLLSSAAEALNGARNIALADGVWRDAALGFDRAFLFFDGGRLAQARESWRSLKGREGVEPRYWKQGETGRWEQAA